MTFQNTLQGEVKNSLIQSATNIYLEMWGVASAAQVSDRYVDRCI
jgi:hypothetical protein